MTFQDFAIGHGLIIESLETDRWIRVKTEDKPTKKNGVYYFDGAHGCVINYATMEKHAVYQSDMPQVIDRQKIQKMNDERLVLQEKAKQKAAWIVKSTVKSQHTYLLRKGFDSKGLVWNDLLVLPMRINDRLVGCQLIDKEGGKKFLSGQITKGASLVIDNKGRDILVEGFATGLSVRRALKAVATRYKIHVCFSANNMLEIAKTVQNPLVVADNDPVGIATAKKIASRYWIGEAGEDFNDYELRLGATLGGASLLSCM
jgi:putative DNA primase/helicase